MNDFATIVRDRNNPTQMLITTIEDEATCEEIATYTQDDDTEVISYKDAQERFGIQQWHSMVLDYFTELGRSSPWRVTVNCEGESETETLLLPEFLLRNEYAVKPEELAELLRTSELTLRGGSGSTCHVEMLTDRYGIG